MRASARATERLLTRCTELKRVQLIPHVLIFWVVRRVHGR